jgi:TrmH family RNA methyltransferase
MKNDQMCSLIAAFVICHLQITIRIMVITSLQNPRVKHVIALRERKQRKRDGLMVVEGHDELTLALACGVKPTTLFYCPSLQSQANASDLLAQIKDLGAEMIAVEARVFEKMAYRENPDGWLATVPIPRLTLADLQLSARPFLVVVEAVEKPGNLGAILRSADAAGVDGVILCDSTVDVGNPNVIRASRGTVFSVRVAEADSREAKAWLEDHQIGVVAATPEAPKLFTAVDLRGPVAVTVGAERQGLSPVWRTESAILARVPMQGKVNSLNVAQAATLFLFEVVRQRSGG